MKAIPTLYRDHLFRSRLEARYATFFDALGEKWVYEPEGFDLDDGDKYLPDFWLPRLNCFVEIKGKEPNAREIRVCRKLQFFTGHDVAIFHGLPMSADGTLFGWDEEVGGRFTELWVTWTLRDGLLAFETGNPSATDPLVEQASAIAKQAQFEFGHQIELLASRPLPSDVDYGRIPF